MKKFTTTNLIAASIAFAAIFLAQTAFAQKYKTAADTIKLNKAYGVVTLDIAKLNTNLIEEQNKTPEFLAKSTSTEKIAVSSAEYREGMLLIATDQTYGDVKTANIKAEKASKAAIVAKNNQDINLKKIDIINEKIAKKQAELVSLNGQKADIIDRLPVFAPEVI